VNKFEKKKKNDLEITNKGLRFCYMGTSLEETVS